MRRKDREVTDTQKIREIFSQCTCCRLGFQDGEKVYVVPLHVGYVQREGRHVLYFHGAKEGRKLELIRKNGYAGFEMDTGYQLRPGSAACEYTAAFQSLIGDGAVTVVEDPAEKELGLTAIMRQSTGQESWIFPKAALDAVCVFRLDVETVSCKEHR